MLMKSEIPVEILNSILNQLPRDTLYQCIFVSKAFHFVSEVLYYSNFESPYDHKRFYKEIKCTRFSGKQLPSLIQKLCIKSSKTKPHKRLSQKELHKLILKLNFLEQLEFDTSYGTKIYLNYLQIIPINSISHLKEIYVRIKSVDGKDTLKTEESYFFKSIQRTDYHELEHDLYKSCFTIIERIPTSISRISIGYFNRDPFENFLELDDIFSALLYYIRESNTLHERMQRFRLEHVLDVYERLEHVAFRKAYIETDDEEPLVLTKTESLKTLRITLEDFSLSDMVYLGKILPERLERLTMQAWSWRFYRLLEEKSNSNIIRSFLKRISQYKQVELGYAFGNRRDKVFWPESFFSSDTIEVQNQKRKSLMMDVLNSLNPDQFPVNLTIGFSSLCQTETEYYYFRMDRMRKKVEICMLFSKSSKLWIDRIDLEIIHSLSLRYDHNISATLLFRDLKSITDIMSNNQRQTMMLAHPIFDGKKCQHPDISKCYISENNTIKICNIVHQ